MSLQWSSAVAAPACGLLGLAIIWLCRGLYHRRWILPLPNALVLFLGFSVLPSALVFCVYPFLSPQPDLTDFFPVLPVAGISLLWTVFATFKQGFSAEPFPNSAPRAAATTKLSLRGMDEVNDSAGSASLLASPLTKSGVSSRQDAGAPSNN